MKILIWNAQHLDNQRSSLFSDTYKDKTELLNNYLLNQSTTSSCVATTSP